jgi:CRP-like cAMP-binding protein
MDILPSIEPPERELALRTTTVRLHDDLLLLVQKLGGLTDRGTAEVIRDALRAYMVANAAENEQFRTFAQEVAARRLAASRSQIEETIGELLPESQAIPLPQQSSTSR